MLESRYAKSTCYGFLSRLRGLWNYAESLGHVEGVNPFNGHKAVKAREVDKKQLFTPDEHSEIQKHVNNESLAMQLLYDLCLYTGCRVSEATGLLKRHIVQEGDITAIFIEKGKTSSATRTVPITQDIATRLSILIENKDDDDPILGIEAKVASRRFSRIKTRYITEDSSKSLHSLRALFATACQRAGIDELYASQLLGHSRGSTMTYGYYARGSTLIKLNVAYEKAVEEIHKYIN
jgi:integrase